jgi:hypothetical protein
MVDINKYCILDLGVLDPIKRILTSDDIRNNELKYWTLMILYQISLSGKQKQLKEYDTFIDIMIRSSTKSPH